DTLTTGHLDIFAWRGSPAARQLSAIGTARETALTRIADILQVDFTGRIRLVFYPDSASKTSQTGHIGNGFASDRTIVEIFNDSVQLDPYHEIAHIVGYQRGSPPAMLDEGFAVFVSELLGADALKYLGSAGMTVQQTVCAARRSGSSLPLGRLFRFTDIGSDSTVPEVSYPESASVVAFLIQRYGIERFRQLYARLQSSSAEPELRRNAQVLEELYGADVDAIERAWVAWLACQP
ncbi:MAG TPA: hypothetical protein VFU23_11990, partial [Gemmatimonadales bacterium]|nr:hypothetical protein [Gemmatimonadales bacterium]